MQTIIILGGLVSLIGVSIIGYKLLISNDASIMDSNINYIPLIGLIIIILGCILK
jgi:ABC-type microcin C transport system permease subunit YejB